MFVFIALARPQIGFHWEEEKQRGIDILFAIDTSKSMLTQDVTPDRLSRAKLAIIDFVRQLGTDRVGLIAFAGDAFLQAPLTLDYDAFQESLDAIDTNVIPRGGTDVASAIREGEAAFGDSKNKKILVLITDGEDLEAKGIEAAKTAAAHGLTIYTVGVGSTNGGLIPIPGANGGTEFVKDASGQFVKSHLDESTLKQIASETGGVYEPLGQHGEGLEKLYTEALAALPKEDVTSRREKVYDDRFQWPLSLGIGLLLASMLIGTRRREEKPDQVTQKAVRRAVTAGLVALMVMGPSASASPQSAERAYKNGQFDDAEDEYEQAAESHPTAPPLQFNVGAAAYKANDYDKALPAFQKALQTDQVGLQQQSYYNLGNTQYRVGEQSETSAPDESIKRWQEAVQSYDAALNLKPDDADAKFNRDFVQKKLDRLQKQQQQKKDQQKKDDQKKVGDDKTEPKGNGKQDANNQNAQSPDKNQQGKNSSDQQGNQSKGQGSGDQKDGKGNGQQPEQGQPGNQGNGQQPGQNPGDQANAQQPGSQPGQGQNSKPDQQGSSGQPKDKQGGDQQANGSQGNPSPDKGPQPGDKGSQPDGKSGDQNSQVAQGQNGQAGSGSQAGATPDKNGSNQQTASTVGEAATPGVLSREEAKELLNSLKNGEHALPVTADARSANHAQNDVPLKDW